MNLTDGSDGGSDPGELNIIATEHARNISRSTPMAKGGSFGLGASVALAIPTHYTTAEVEDQAVINGAKDVGVRARSHLETDSFARAGVNGGVALSPVVAVTLVDTGTLARVGARTRTETVQGVDETVVLLPTTLTGNVWITAEHRGDSESHADGSVESTGAAIGLSVGARAQG